MPLPVELRRERPMPVTETVSLLQVHHLRVPAQPLQPRVRITVALRGARRARVAHIQTEGDRHRGRAVKRRHQLLGRIQLRRVFPRDRHDFPKQEVELARSRVLGQHANRRDDVGDGPLSLVEDRRTGARSARRYDRRPRGAERGGRIDRRSVPVPGALAHDGVGVSE